MITIEFTYTHDRHPMGFGRWHVMVRFVTGQTVSSFISDREMNLLPFFTVLLPHLIQRSLDMITRSPDAW